MAVPSSEELNLLHNSICRAVGDPTRIQILYALKDNPLYVTQLAEELNIPQPTISRHLAVLRERTLVRSERDGASVIYHLGNPLIIDILDSMRQLLRETVNYKSNVLE